jgi:hypothetical protein
MARAVKLAAVAPDGRRNVLGARSESHAPFKGLPQL